MMTCRELAELLVDFVAGELTPEQRARFEQHLECCPPCVFFVESYQITIRISRHLPCAGPLPDRLRHLCEKMLREGNKGGGCGGSTH